MPRIEKLLALDVGSKKTGIAIADTCVRQARPLTVLHHLNIEQGVKQVLDLLQEWGSHRLILGIPVVESDQTLPAFFTIWHTYLQEAVSCPIETVDERHTSQIANQWKRLHPEWPKDALAATIILQAWLDS